jgi:hypothetical protein
LRDATELLGRRRFVRDRVRLAGQLLEHAAPHQLDRLVADRLVLRDQVVGDTCDVAGELVDGAVELGRRHCLHRQTDALCRRAVDAPAAQQQTLRPLRPDQVGPHVRRGRAHRAHGGKAELGIVAGDDHVAVERHVGATGQAVAVHLGDHGLGAVPQHRPAPGARRQRIDVLADRHLLGVALAVARAFGLGRQVPARAEGPPGALEHDGADRVVGLRGLHGIDQLVHQRTGQGVELLGAVERQVRDAVADLAENGFACHVASPLPAVWPAMVP